MQSDARQHQREIVHVEEIHGEFSIETGAEKLAAANMLDVSVSGAGFTVDKPLDINTPVALTFSAGGWAVTVEGTVVWRQASQEERSVAQPQYRVGVRFHRHNERNNVLFFQASQSVMNLVH